MSVIKTTLFVCPIAGMFLFMAAFASEHLITTSTLYRWGFITKCQPGSGSDTNTQICLYMAPGENAGYFEAAKCLASISVLMYIGLLWHFTLINISVCRHQLAAIWALILSILLVLVILLIGTSYSADPRWQDLEPALGWSYWLLLPACGCSFVSACILSYRGREEYLQRDSTKISSKIHPESLAAASATNSDVVVGVEGGDRTPASHLQQQPEEPQGVALHSHPDGEADGDGEVEEEGDGSGQTQKRPRRLSPILERAVVSNKAAGGEERGSELPPPKPVTPEPDDPSDSRALSHHAPEILVTPHSPVPEASCSEEET